MDDQLDKYCMAYLEFSRIFLGLCRKCENYAIVIIFAI